MKLDRNILSRNGRGKYALLKLRSLDAYEPRENFTSNPIWDAVGVLDKAGLIEWGAPDTEGEFFVLKMRDKFARKALLAYADGAVRTDMEYAKEVGELASRAGELSKFCKVPD